MRSVIIMLSTYNGEKYLRDQLDSLYAQTGVNIHILVRDDGSKDDTISILEDYKNRFGKIDIIRGDNIGAGPSFYKLIDIVVKQYGKYDYYAFCDQDDVWLNHKIETGVAALEQSERELRLFFSSVINADASLNPISSSCVRVVNSFGANLVANHILGCTMLMDAPMLKEINKINTVPYTIPDGYVPIHDGWAAFVAYTLNADVIQDDAELMYYRQHEHNVVGSGHGFFSIQKNRIKRYLIGTTHNKANKCIIALQVLGDEIPKQNRQLLELVAKYRESKKTKMRLMIDKRMYQYSFIDNMGTFLTLLFNKF